MKKILMVIFFVLFTAASAFCGEFEDTLKKAEQGDAKAQGMLGLMYEQGKGVKQDSKQAVHWYTKAAEQGFDFAQFKLGYMYETGKGVVQDYKQAVHWFTKAAEQGFERAQFYLGIMYLLGQGVTQNHKLSYVWLNLAAAQGDKDAIETRDSVAKKLSPQQLAEAQELSAKKQYQIEHPSGSKK